MIKTKKIVITVLLTLLLGPVVAQERSDTTYVFRFVPAKDMFYVPWNGNGDELDRLLRCVEQHEAAILEGRMPVYVDGYCSSLGSEAENLATARTRSNRVKSELIVRGGLTEACFVTHNHAEEGDLVVVRLVVPAAPTAEAPCEAGATHPVTEPSCPAPQPEAEAAEQALPTQAADEERSASASDCYHFALRANLLRWATLTPDLGIEWRISPSWGIQVNGSWTTWTWQGKDRRYALWEVAPEVRYYMGREKRGYLGAMYKAGQFNYKLCATGRQGDLMGGGLTGGYLLRLNDALSLDFSLTVGCLHADYEKYEVIDGVRVRRGTDAKNWWGPINAGVTFVWHIF